MCIGCFPTMNRHPAVHHGRFYYSFQVFREAEKHRLWMEVIFIDNPDDVNTLLVYLAIYFYVWLLITVDCTYADDVLLVLYAMAHLHNSPVLLFMFLASARVNMPVYAVWAGPVMYQCWDRELVVQASVHYQRNRTNPNAFCSRLLTNLDVQPIEGPQIDNDYVCNEERIKPVSYRQTIPDQIPLTPFPVHAVVHWFAKLVWLISEYTLVFKRLGSQRFLYYF